MFSLEDFKLEGLRHIVLDGGSRSGKTKSFSDTEGFVNTLYYADIVVNICSTLSIDAAAFDTPAIVLDYEDPGRKVPHWEHIHRLNAFDHQEALIRTGGVRTPRSVEEFTRDINAYLSNPALEKEGRARIIEEFVAPFDGKAGERLANILLEELGK
jgi:hypothetical protein